MTPSSSSNWKVTKHKCVWLASTTLKLSRVKGHLSSRWLADLSFSASCWQVLPRECFSMMALSILPCSSTTSSRSRSRPSSPAYIAKKHTYMWGALPHNSNPLIRHWFTRKKNSWPCHITLQFPACYKLFNIIFSKVQHWRKENGEECNC